MKTLLATDGMKQSQPKRNIKGSLQFKDRTKQKLYQQFDLNHL